MMKETDMIYVAKLPEGIPFESLDEAEQSRIVEENSNTIDRIEEEAIKRGSLLYRFIYEPTEQGVAIYQIIKINRISCMIRYCPVGGRQNIMTEQWGSEAHVGTKYIMQHVRTWDMAAGLGDNINADPAQITELAYQYGSWYLYIQTCEEGYDYSIYDESYRLYADGVYDDAEIDIAEVADILLKDMENELDNLSGAAVDVVNPEFLAEAAGNANAILHEGIDPAILIRLIAGNAGDEVALKNICEVHLECMEELTDDEKDFYIETNNFYRSAEEFCCIHSSEPEYFENLLKDGIIVKTSDGYVWKNCV